MPSRSSVHPERRPGSASSKKKRLGGMVDASLALSLEAGDTGLFGELMHEHWVSKKKRSGGMVDVSLALSWGPVGAEDPPREPPENKSHTRTPQ